MGARDYSDEILEGNRKYELWGDAALTEKGLCSSIKVSGVYRAGFWIYLDPITISYVSLLEWECLSYTCPIIVF